jgi:hypothetical protein
MWLSHALIPRNNSGIVVSEHPAWDHVVHLVIDGLSSDHSRRAYARALHDFLTWHALQGHPVLSKAVVQRYRLVCGSVTS